MSYRASLGTAIRELRFIMCQQSAASAGARQFVAKNYSDIKALNPTLPFIVRECTNAQPTVMARYNYGVERRVYLNDLSEAEVDQVVGDLASQADQINKSL